MAKPPESTGEAVRYPRSPYSAFGQGGRRVSTACHGRVLRPYSAVLMALFRQTGCELAASLVRRWPLLVLLACSGIVGATWHWGLRVNTSRSVPRGLYRMRDVAPTRGALVALCLRPEIARFGRARGYLGPGDCPDGIQAVIKQVIALPGDTVEVTPAEIRVNGDPLPRSATCTEDSAGRPLPHVAWGRHRVAPAQVWLLGPGDPRSWDSRYFGPLSLAHIRATMAPVVTLD